MTDTRKTAETKPDVTDDGPSDATPARLTEGFGRTSDQREFGDVHIYTFEDGTSAKVWTGENKTHVSVQLRDVRGRGFTSSTHEDVTISAANKLIEDAGQKAKDEVAKAAAAN